MLAAAVVHQRLRQVVALSADNFRADRKLAPRSPP